MNSSATGNKPETMNNLNSEGENAGSQQQVCYENGGEKLIFKKEEHGDQIFDAMRKQNSFYDVTLEVDEGSTIKAHKMILASCSPYFHTIFTNFEGRNQNEIKIHGIDHSTLKILLDFIYTSQITITEDNVQGLLPAANFLQLIDVRDACCVFLKNQLHVSNCCQVRDFAEIHECSELVTHVDNYIEKNFLKFIEEDAFLALAPERVIKIISSDNLVVPSEEKVFESVISWIKADLENRECASTELMEHIRFPLLSMDYLTKNVDKEPLFKANWQSHIFLSEAIEYHLLRGEMRSHSRTPRTKLRQPRDQQKILLVFGGSNTFVSQVVEYYDFEEGKWFKKSEVPSALVHKISTVFDGRLCLVGGYDRGLNVSSQIEFYDFMSGQCLAGTPIQNPRSHHAVTVLDDHIYVLGGSDESNSKSVEFYNPNTNEWKFASPMLTGRGNFAVGVVNGLLYAVGGMDNFNNHSPSVEYYNPKSNEWKQIAGMSTPRRGLGVGVIDGILYAIGGHDGNSYLKSGEAYDPEKNQWTRIPDMKHRRKFHGVTTSDGLLYVVGGESEYNTSLNSVEVYSPKNNCWTILSLPMSTNKVCCNVAMINK